MEVDMEKPKLTYITFDESKQAHIGAALRRLAAQQDHDSHGEERASLRDGEVVSLLSDSEDDDESVQNVEVFGYLSTQPENAVDAQCHMTNKDGSLEQRESNLLYLQIDDIEYTTEAMVKANETVKLEACVDTNVVHCKSALDLNGNGDDDLIKYSQAMLSSQIQIPKIAAVHTGYVPTQTKVNSITGMCIEELRTEANSVLEDSQHVRVPAPQAVEEYSLEDGTTNGLQIVEFNENVPTHTVPACSFEVAIDNSNSMTPPETDYIIELDDSSDDDRDIDAEMENKLIELLDSDDEDNIQEQYNEEGSLNASATGADNASATGADNASNNNMKTIDMLMHYHCPECDHPCGSLKKWRVHMQVEHDFEAIANLNMRTIIDRNGGLQYQCKDCQKKFQRKRSYGRILEHRVTHMPFPCYYKCRICPSRFKNRIALRRHLSKDHYKICKEYLGKKPTLWKYITLYCPVCNAKQSNINRWRKHLDDKHDYSNRIENELMTKESIAGVNVYTCHECSRKVGRHRYFEHCINHEAYQSLLCNLCTMFSCNTRSQMLGHVRLTHLEVGKPKYPCLYCETKFFTRLEREMHVKQKHHIKKLKCKICDREFTTPQLLLTHMRKSNHERLK